MNHHLVQLIKDAAISLVAGMFVCLCLGLWYGEPIPGYAAVIIVLQFFLMLRQ